MHLQYIRNSFVSPPLTTFETFVTTNWGASSLKIWLLSKRPSSGKDSWEKVLLLINYANSVQILCYFWWKIWSTGSQKIHDFDVSMSAVKNFNFSMTMTLQCMSLHINDDNAIENGSFCNMVRKWHKYALKGLTIFNVRLCDVTLNRTNNCIFVRIAPIVWWSSKNLAIPFPVNMHT